MFFKKETINISDCRQLVRHGTAHQGPLGPRILSRPFTVTRERAVSWQQDCTGGDFCLQEHPLQMDANELKVK